MKIFYLIKNLDKVPSCAYNIQLLNKIGYTVVPILGASTDGINKNMDADGIHYHVMTSADSKGSILRFVIAYRSFVKKILDTQIEPDDLVIYGTADTAISLMGIREKHRSILCIKELYDNNKQYRKILIHLAKKADVVIACEKNRARIMQFEWGLETRPYVLANKPFYHPRCKNCAPTTEKTAQIIQQIQSKPCIVYQSNHIWYVKELEVLSRALCNTQTKYCLLLIGHIDNQNDIDMLRDIYPNIVTTDYLPSPSHMDITSYARIGLTIYDENSLNNLFCAPNKIYEYAGYGIPTLANDVPGLVQTIGISRAGECIDWSNPEKICQAIERIESEYDVYSRRASEFFDQTDNENILDQIIKTVLNKEIRG